MSKLKIIDDLIFSLAEKTENIKYNTVDVSGIITPEFLLNIIKSSKNIFFNKHHIASTYIFLPLWIISELYDFLSSKYRAWGSWETESLSVKDSDIDMILGMSVIPISDCKKTDMAILFNENGIISKVVKSESKACIFTTLIPEYFFKINLSHVKN